MHKPGDIEKEWKYSARYLPNFTSRAHDGDTCYVEVDFGDYQRCVAKLRLAGIDTPERGEEGHKEAAEWLRETLLTYTVDYGPWFEVHTKKARAREKYGRLLAEIVLPEKGMNVGEELLRLGLAKVWGS